MFDKKKKLSIVVISFVISLFFGCTNSNQNNHTYIIESKPLTELETQMLKDHLLVVGNDIKNMRSILWRDIRAERKMNTEEYLKQIMILSRSYNRVLSIITGKKVDDEMLGFDSFFFTWALLKVNPKGQDKEVLEAVLRILHLWYGDSFIEDFMKIGKAHPAFLNHYTQTE